MVIHESIQLMSRRRVGLTDFCTWAVWAKVIEQSPGTDRSFGRTPMTMEKASAIQPTGHGIHMAIQHVTGPMCVRMIISQDKALHFCAQLECRFQNIASGILLCP